MNYCFACGKWRDLVCWLCLECYEKAIDKLRREHAEKRLDRD